MRAAVRDALEHGVAIGAHPGYPDREGFGRRELALQVSRIAELLRAQCLALLEVLAEAGAPLQHVKLHGALYHRAGRDPAVAETVADIVAAIDPRLIVVGMAGSTLARACARRGLPYAREAFADRGYAADGRLLPRSEPGGLIAVDAVAARAERMVLDGVVQGGDGASVPVAFDTLCLHGDAPDAVSSAWATRQALDAAGVVVTPMSVLLTP